MKKNIITLLLCFISLFASSQSNKLITDLEHKRSELQRQIANTESLLKSTKKTVGSQLDNLALLTGRIEERKRYILGLNNDIETITIELNKVDAQYKTLEKELDTKKNEYAKSLRYMYRNKSVEEKLMFIFAAQNLEQMYRRMRYVKEYAGFQRKQGELIVAQQTKLQNKLEELQQVKRAKQKILLERQQEKKKLENQEKEKRELLSSLKRKQKDLQVEVNKKRKEATKLNSKIDKLIAEELEKARKKAQEEAKRASQRKQNSTSKTPAKVQPAVVYTMTKEDQKISGVFSENRGKLPVPVSGPYIIVSHYGQYAVAGLKNVKLDNKGIDIQGKPGAKAIAIFKGKVAAVFQLNGLFNVLIRHGSYISVYCNLKSASVEQGDTVEMKQELGIIFSDPTDNNRTILHFQLRKEKDKLNPEPWLYK